MRVAGSAVFLTCSSGGSDRDPRWQERPERLPRCERQAHALTRLGLEKRLLRKHSFLGTFPLLFLNSFLEIEFTHVQFTHLKCTVQSFWSIHHQQSQCLIIFMPLALSLLQPLCCLRGHQSASCLPVHSPGRVTGLQAPHSVWLDIGFDFITERGCPSCTQGTCNLGVFL